MRIQINADGTAVLVPATERPVDGATPPHVVLSGAMGGGAAAGLVPLWLLEQERKEREEAAEKQRLQEETERAERQREADRATTQAAAEATEAAARADAERAALEAQAEAEAAAEQQRLREADEQQRTSQESHAAPSAAQAGRTEDEEARSRAGQQDQQSHAQSVSDKEDATDPAESDRAREAADAAARLYAEQQALARLDEHSRHLSAHDPAQALLDSLSRSAFFRELLPHNAWSFVQSGRPFAILILCSCAADDDWDIPALENLMVDRGLHHAFASLFVRSPTREQFQMAHTYGLDPLKPAFVIENIPIGQHVEKYSFSQDRLARPKRVQPLDLANFLSDFLRAPTPLRMLLRSHGHPASHSEQDSDSFNERGKVIEVVGSTFEEIVLRTHAPVLLMLHSPTCPACQRALPVLDQLAERMAWSAAGFGAAPSHGAAAPLRIVRIDRSANDLPVVLRFASYPAGDKSADSNAAMGGRGEEPANRGLAGSRGWVTPKDYFAEQATVAAASGGGGGGQSCNAPLNADDLEAWIGRHIGDEGARMIGGGGGGEGTGGDGSDGANQAASEAGHTHASEALESAAQPAVLDTPAPAPTTTQTRSSIPAGGAM